MPIGALSRAGVGNPGSAATFMVVGSLGSVVQIVSDAKATAATATQLAQPFSFASSHVSWVKRGKGANRIALYARQALAGQTLVTSPVVRLYGAYPTSANPTLPDNNAGAFPTDGTWMPLRIDSPTDFDATDLTLTLASSGSPMTALRSDGTYAYSDETTAYDLLDCHYFTVLVSTAASITGAVSVWGKLYA